MVPIISKILDRINNLENKHTYSTQEQKIGTWLGKTLYRKVYTGILLNSEETVIDTSFLQKNVINAYGSYVYQNNTLFFGKSDNETGLTNRLQVTANGIFKIYHTNNIANSKYQVIIEYTKTTD